MHESSTPNNHLDTIDGPRYLVVTFYRDRSVCAHKNFPQHIREQRDKLLLQHFLLTVLLIKHMRMNRAQYLLQTIEEIDD